jgi:hypothetical protein
VNPWLLAGGVASAAAAVAHLLCIPGGARWYRAMGAGERMVRAVARGEARPHLVTLVIAAVLATWAAYALSGAGVLPRLPLLRPVLAGVAAAYLLRGAALPLLRRVMPDRSPAFLAWSSIFVFLMGLVHAIGLAAGPLP